jgi:hypothetical protein
MYESMGFELHAGPRPVRIPLIGPSVGSLVTKFAIGISYVLPFVGRIDKVENFSIAPLSPQATCMSGLLLPL